MSQRRFLPLLLAAFAMDEVASGPVSRAATLKGKFLWFSDPHYDKYYGTAQAYSPDACGVNVSDYRYGVLGCDSPWLLVERTFQVHIVLCPVF